MGDDYSERDEGTGYVSQRLRSSLGVKSALSNHNKMLHTESSVERGKKSYTRNKLPGSVYFKNQS
jgi:hypothetical protein